VIADAKNQTHTGVGAPADYTYDAAGNMTSDITDGVTASYDAENRISTATRTGATTTYVYDADGNRVEKSNGTLYWYMTPGIVAESDLARTPKRQVHCARLECQAGACPLRRSGRFAILQSVRLR
jgi:YD repeat-containing protein